MEDFKKMNMFGREVNSRMMIWFGLQALIIVDIVLITIAMLISLPKDIALGISIFDFCVCIILLVEWSINFYISKPKKVFLKQKNNWLDLIASIPVDALLPAVFPSVSFLRYLRLLKFLRVLALFNRFYNGFEKFLKKTNLHNIFGIVFLTILIFTLILYIFGSSYGIFDDFYFVIVTLTTVGYGDVVPKTFNEKIITIVLIFIGLLVFSTITAVISSYFTDRLLNEEDEEMEDKMDSILNELKSVRSENKMLKDEINELKEMIDNK